VTTFLDSLNRWLEYSPATQALLFLLGLGLLAGLANWMTKNILLRSLGHLFSFWGLEQYGQTPLQVIARLANFIPAVVVMLGVRVVPDLPPALVTIVQNVCAAFIALTLALAVSGLLTLVNEIHQRRPDANQKPIKGYIQVLKIVVFVIAAILVVANLMDRSPLILISGLGAMAAVLMLIFQDTLLSLVASVQIGSNDMVRVGDWIEMPQLHADGSVIDIALHTVKVQNWDKTITTVPTKRLISDSFRNWRGMQESGGRRIKRSLYIDQQSIRFLDADERRQLGRFHLLADYLAAKEEELAKWNRERSRELDPPQQNDVNLRRLTNIGTFRHYVDRYLRRHPGIHQGMTLMVRQLSPTADGLPLEIYCFTNTTAWVGYEGIQSDIFDHLLAILPEFGLRVFQNPGGADMRALGPALVGQAAPTGAATRA